jgi:hypothetical protein
VHIPPGIPYSSCLVVLAKASGSVGKGMHQLFGQTEYAILSLVSHGMSRGNIWLVLGAGWTLLNVIYTCIDTVAIVVSK